ncbi:prephenate dehydrogenase/arogenate dehydrogenase family protein [Halostagnicola kamekurae]|uniref:Prephenate dehydrogenase n=1 Tax=Halostagnicola kamekurae TaxID=619731 RepID=A0A1I6SF44_9EURY|nr:prephenate dehydrogenase/arogenate dehydrogenase family protein [Halostagnicola kamekurae]SFS75557.1 prephenate dehydrogenase [Halostagnicola kamekurae]
MDVLIVGGGSMGTWFGSAVDATIAYTDIDPDAAADAAAATNGRVADLENEGGYDAVCLAVPMAHVGEAVAEYAPVAERAILDVSGVMAAPIEAMNAHASDIERVSLHPLFAPERAPGTVAVVREANGQTTERLLEDLTAAGNDLLETTVAEHDEAMETIQARTHAAILAFALAAREVPDGFETPVYDGIEDLAKTVTGGTPHVYGEIQRTFDGADAVADAAAQIAEADGEEFERLYESIAERWREDTTPGSVADRDRTADAADASHEGGDPE